MTASIGCLRDYLGCMGLAFLCAVYAPPESPCAATERHRSTVPPSEEIEVLDPNADPLGKPAVELRPGPCNSLQVDIPRTVLVHKFYYTGDRSFQAQFLPGGPSVVVVNHPKTGERCYIDVQMLPGAPNVTYTAHCIEYVFGKDAVIISFPPLCCPKVVYRHGTPLSSKIVHAAQAAENHHQQFMEQTGLSARMAQCRQQTKTTLVNAAHRIRDAGKMVVAPVCELAKRTPLGSLAQPKATDVSQRQRDVSVQRVQNAEAEINDTISTIR